MEGEINLKKLTRVFLRRKYTFFFTFTLVVLGITIKTKLTPKTYVATSKILIKTTYIFEERKIITKEKWTEATCYEILKSRGFLERAVEYMKEKGIKLPILEIPNSAEILINWVNPIPIKNTNIVNIDVRYKDAEGAAILANGIAEAFVHYITDVEKEEDKRIKEFVEKQIPKVKEKLQETENELIKFKKKEMILSAEASRDAIQEHLSSLKKKYNAVVCEIEEKSNTLALLEEKLKEEKEKLPEKTLRRQLVTLEAQYSSYISGTDKNHPELIKLKEKIEETKQKLKELTQKEPKDEISVIEPLVSLEELYKSISQKRNELLSLQTKKEAIEVDLKKYREYAKKFPEKEQQLIELEREKEFNERVYKKLLDAYEETKLKEVGKIGGVTIVEYANPPLFPEHPKPRRNLILGIIFGMGLGIVLVVLKEHLDNKIKEIEEIKEENIPIIGTIPFHKEGISNPMSLEAEYYKRIKVNLNFMGGNNNMKILLVSSCNPGEGKTTVVANLGTTYARSGKRTVIVEGDFRNPALSKIFQKPQICGLSHYLADEATLEEIINPTEIENLYIISAGYLPPDPTKIIETEKFKFLIDMLKDKFDSIIIDSPPISFCADAYILKDVVDGVMLVIELNRTEKDILKETIESMSDKKFIGVIINKIKREKRSYYYNYKYYYYRKTL